MGWGGSMRPWWCMLCACIPHARTIIRIRYIITSKIFRYTPRPGSKIIIIFFSKRNFFETFCMNTHRGIYTIPQILDWLFSPLIYSLIQSNELLFLWIDNLFAACVYYKDVYNKGVNNYGDRLRKSEWEVRPLSKLSIASKLVQKFHYAHGASNTATYLHGLFQRGELWEGNCLGIAWWIPPTKSAALATYPKNWRGVLCLSRLVVVPDVPKNAATFLMAQSRKQINRNDWPCLVTYADEWQGHKGTIYLADNWDFVGKTKPEAVYIKDGRMMARKAGPHTRTHAQMLDLGCEFLGRFSKSKYVRMR